LPFDNLTLAAPSSLHLTQIGVMLIISFTSTEVLKEMYLYLVAWQAVLHSISAMLMVSLFFQGGNFRRKFIWSEWNADCFDVFHAEVEIEASHRAEFVSY